MATNTAVLLIVAATAALVLAGMLAVVVSKTRTGARDGTGATMTEEPAKQVGDGERVPTNPLRGRMRPSSRSKAACSIKRRPIEAKRSPRATN